MGCHWANVWSTEDLWLSVWVEALRPETLLLAPEVVPMDLVAVAR